MITIDELIAYLNEQPTSGFSVDCYDEDDDFSDDDEWPETTQSYIHNDGGRAKSGRKGTTGDCGVRAMAIALGIEYDAAYKELAQANKDNGRAKSMRSGIYKEAFGDVLARYGWVWHPAPKFDGRKARCSDMPSGTVIARQSRHFVAVIDGTPCDIFDSSEKMVYGYWAKG